MAAFGKSSIAGLLAPQSKSEGQDQSSQSHKLSSGKAAVATIPRHYYVDRSIAIRQTDGLAIQMKEFGSPELTHVHTNVNHTYI